MNENAQKLRQMMKAAGLTRKVTADLLTVSLHTVDSWLKPEGNKSGFACPSWAPVLLTYRINDKGAMRPFVTSGKVSGVKAPVN